MAWYLPVDITLPRRAMWADSPEEAEFKYKKGAGGWFRGAYYNHKGEDVTAHLRSSAAKILRRYKQHIEMKEISNENKLQGAGLNTSSTPTS